MKPTSFVESVNCAIEGILYTARTQKHMRHHFLAALVVLVAALLLRVTLLEFMLLALAISFVLFAELLNTAIEVVVDMISPEFNPMAKLAKDVAAGAVLVAAFGTAIMGYLVLSKYIFPVEKRLLAMVGTGSELGILVSVILVLIAVIILKGVTGSGTPLKGGVPSGHSAVAFSIATSVTLQTQDPLIALLCLILALMVSHSRLLLKIHTVRELVYGALTGISITVAVNLLFNAFA
ncbi:MULTISPECIES: diacylglycerol kinase [Citrifermentans]|uniref:Diacylglycerol kinase-like protein n=1 Tax=Citrifermentans bemidjiense (strain ATCC BAA-1014 / DSM 16622 / JCM 12645 / Bem) TaxID=404380 RepID=B5EGF5_CITBB|nr:MULTISPECIES: diacylglycerol kinase [Citrifermentans]ACH38020.1 diacylglycerol kinase-like protein [Citrifermentans bemidjiense Bem]